MILLMHFDSNPNRLGSRFRVNKTSPISERYSVQMKAAMKQKRFMMLAEIYLSVIKSTQHLATKSCATAGIFILNLLY